RTLYFTRRNHPRNTGGTKDKGDIWFSRLADDGSWSAPERADANLNTTGYNAVVGFSEGGDIIYLQNLYKNGKPGKQGVSIATRSGSGWSSPRPVDIPYFYNRAPHQSISLSPDGSVMLMAVESRFSYGAEDIYISLKRGKEWSEPINLGRTINTRFQEMTPHLAADNRTLFFASNGHRGKGSRDIFMSTRLDDTWKNWSEPKNLGEAINSPGVELSYFIPAGSEYAYFTSTRNSDGYGDLRRIKLSPDQMPDEAEPVIEEPVVQETDTVQAEPEVEVVAVDTADIEIEVDVEEAVASVTLVLNGRVNDERSGNGIAATITAYAPAAADTISLQSDSDGTFIVELDPEQSYTIKAAARGYLSSEVSYEGGGDGQDVVLELVPLEVGTTVQLDNILFRRGTPEILPGSENDLRRVYEVLSENPGIRIELGGHTDNRGSGRLNLKLSRERVEAVKAYLVEMGIDDKRIEGVGYGGTKPIASNSTEETRRLNRRVEFVITGK
ncbi:MAG: OmpA family protein, partial [Cyclobacteriaceae bacterium]